MNLVALDIGMEPGETRSGVQALNPKIYGRYEAGDMRVAFVVIHPTNNVLNHYLVAPLAARGAGVLALNTRYLGNEAFLIVERAMLDLGAGVRFLRAQGYRHVCLIGNSGGASLSALYQAEAERRTITHLVDGRRFDYAPEDLPRADSLALVAAHPGRAITLTARLDASVLDERDLFATDPALDIFDQANGPPFSPGFLERVRAAQLERSRRITAWCQARLREFARRQDRTVVDQVFPVYRTMADPRFVDLSIDPNGRAGGTALESDAAAANYAVNATAALTSIRSWLSQWSIDLSRGDGPACLARTSAPVLLLNFSSDEIVYPSDVQAWTRAAAGRAEIVEMAGVGHYPQRIPGKADEVADLLMRWVPAPRGQ